MSIDGDFVIEEVTDLDAVWPEIETLVLGIAEYHQPWDTRTLRDDWAPIMRDYMRSCGLTLLARDANGEAVGFLSGDIPTGDIFREVIGHIDNVYLLERARRQGVGSALVSRFEAWCREQGASEVRLDVNLRNEPGLRFWARSGYTATMQAMSKPLEVT